MPIQLQSPHSVGIGTGGSGDMSDSVKTIEYNVRNMKPYDYPMGLDFKPGSKLHERIKAAVIQRSYMSRDAIKPRMTKWDAIDEKNNLFIVQDKDEDDAKNLDSRRPTSIVIPMSYANRETFLTYLMLTFLESPIFRYRGFAPEDTAGAALLELVIEWQMQRAKGGLGLYTQWKDACTYGYGILIPSWTVERAERRVRRPGGAFSETLGQFIPNGMIDESIEEYVSYEGHKFVNIEPRNYLPDPAVPVHDPQAGEFVGYLTKENRLTLLGDEENEASGLFNVRYLKNINGKSFLSIETERASTVSDRYPDEEMQWSGVQDNRVDVIRMYITLIPEEWGLGEGTRPEKWVFAVAADNVVIQAEPLGLFHKRYPVTVQAPETDGYQIGPIGRFELTYGLQEFFDFLINSHMRNVAKAVNDMLVVDPSIVNIADVRRPGAGKIIRMRQSAMGKSARDGIHQLQINDITRANVGDAVFIGDMMQRIMSSPDSLQGIMRQTSERRSATESRDTRSSAFSRIEGVAKILAMQGHYDMAYLLASQTQQLMTEGVYVRLMGRHEDELRAAYNIPPGVNIMPVGPSEISVAFDVVPHDGTIPNEGTFESAQMLWNALLANPNLAQMIGVQMPQLTRHMMRLAGFRNIGDFMQAPPPIVPQVLPDEQVGNMAASGQIQAMPQGGSQYGGI